MDGQVGAAGKAGSCTHPAARVAPQRRGCDTGTSVVLCTSVRDCCLSGTAAKDLAVSLGPVVHTAGSSSHRAGKSEDRLKPRGTSAAYSPYL